MDQGMIELQDALAEAALILERSSHVLAGEHGGAGRWREMVVLLHELVAVGGAATGTVSRIELRR